MKGSTYLIHLCNKWRCVLYFCLAAVKGVQTVQGYTFAQLFLKLFSELCSIESSL